MVKAFIGTSGWVYPHWQPKFYPQNLPQKNWLLYYEKHFDTVEINATFYHLMKPKTFENWRKIVGSEFVFAIKASRFITHIKKLKDCKEPLERLIEGIKKLGSETIEQLSNKNVVLFQLPPNFKADSGRLKNFVQLLPLNFRFAFEFRDKSWLSEETCQILRGANCALVIQDSPRWPSVEVLTSEFTYLRFHGRESLYSSCYTKDELKDWAEKIKTWLKKEIDVYAYFNNDVEGFAIDNAKTLRELVKSEK